MRRTPHPDLPWLWSGRVPCLDGLRAVAIALVLFGHTVNYNTNAGPHRLTRVAGWGVDLFFAISGFIITLLLLREWRQSRSFSLRHFYFRRTLRILPPYAAFLGFIFLAQLLAIFELQPQEWRGLLTFTLNWVYVKQVSILHIWSLSLEEQFYLLWPLVLLTLGPRRALGFAVGLIALTPLIRLAVRQFPLDVPYFVMTPNRLDGLMAGCTVALLASGMTGYRLPDPGHLGPRWFLFFAIGLFTFQEAMEVTPRPISSLVYYSGIAVIMAGLVWTAISSGPGRLTRFLNHPAAVWIGTLSYSLYLWQQPFLFWDAGPLALRLVLIFALAITSYYLIERPILRWRQRREPRQDAHPVSRQIVPALTPRVTATHAPDALARPAQRPVFLDGQDHVLAATGVETTPTAEEGAERVLVGPYQQDQEPGHGLGQVAEHEPIVREEPAGLSRRGC